MAIKRSQLLLKAGEEHDRCIQPGRRFSLFVAILWLCISGVTAQAQFVRIGPFDFGASADLDLIYSTNVEGVRPGATDKEMKDYYAVASFNLASSSTSFRNSAIDLSTGITVERHLRRADLDTTSDPFGQGQIDTAFELGRYTLRLNLANQTTFEEKEGTYTPSGSRNKRDVRTVTDYGAELEWKRNDLTVAGGATGSRERHREDEFKVADQNKYSTYLNGDWQFSERLGLNFAYKREKTDLINVEDSCDGWDEKTTVGLEFMILERPHLTYTLGAEKSKVQDEEIGWEPTHTLTLDDHFEFSPRTRLSGNVSYKYADKYADDEVALTCNAVLENELSRTAQQSLRVSKQPAGTFGSTEKTDVTSVDYVFRKDDLFIYNLNFTFNASYKHNRPMGEGAGEIEDITRVSPELSWNRAVSRKINRTLSYLYRWEHSSLESENLTEHRVTLSYTYTF